MTAREANQIADDVRARADELNAAVEQAVRSGLRVELDTETDYSNIETHPDMPIVRVRVFREV